MRFTIERLRTLVLGLGGLLIAALIGFLAVGKWKSHFILHEIPKKLGVDIKQEANEVVYTQSRGGHTLFKIRASKEIQLKKSGRVKLQNVQIELYGEDGARVDRITGNEFEYDQKAGKATATGPVEIAISRPAKMLNAAHEAGKLSSGLATMAQGAASGQIDVKTNGLVFDQKSGTASTGQRVEFSTVQGNGSSEGAIFDSSAGTLVLDRAVELNVRRGDSSVVLHARHAEFDRTGMVCRMQQADAGYRGATVKTGQAQLAFRDDGSVMRLDARDGVALASINGSRAEAPTGWVVFNEKNEPQRARLEGGVQMASQAPGKVLRGSAPAADLSFTAGGELRHAHLSNGVELRSEQQANGSSTTRDWRSPVMDADFRAGKDGRLALATLTGTGGVVVMGRTQQPGGKPQPSRMSADIITGDFGPAQQLTRMVGQGHAQLEQTSQSGMRQTASADRLDAILTGDRGPKSAPASNSEIESATLDGNVSFSQQQDGGTGEAMRGTAEHAVYDGPAEAVHLSGNPRVDQAGLQLSADRIDVQQKSGEAFAHHNVKATWFGGEKNSTGEAPAMTMGGSGPAHVVADEAEMQQATGVATFRGHARLWQQANSIAAPVIALNRTRQTLEARAAGASQPVSLVLMNAGTGQKGKGAGASVLRVRAGELRYSDAERKAMLHAGATGPVLADMGTATSSSDSLDVMLLPPGNHAGQNGEAAQVDRIVARGDVQLKSGSRSGIGQRLEYSSETGDYVLTGTPAAPPRLTDTAHGAVTGASLIFNTRDDSVRVEGEGRRTSTETTAPR